ncbi:MAG: aspartate aminotransferase family protein, partial [Thermoplasmata archaeon]
KNREKKTQFNTYMDKIEGKTLMVDKLSKAAMEKNVYINSWINHLIIAPPLIINENELLSGLDVIDNILEISDREVV